MVGTPSQRASGSSALLAVLIVLLVGELLWMSTGWAGFAWVGRIAFLGLCLMGRQFFTLREATLLGFAIVASVAVWMSGLDLGVLVDGLGLAAFFGAFIGALTVMRDIAARSGSILSVGRYLTTQPPSRRFYSTALGGHLMGVFLNFGAVSLMAPLIQRSAIDADGVPDPVMERRQLSALIRGFAWVLLWAPTTLSQAVLLTIFTDVTWMDIGPLGIFTALGFIILGRLVDRRDWRGGDPIGPDGRLPVPWRAILTVGMICTVLIGATLVGTAIFGGSIAQTLMFVAPAVTLGWYFAQTSVADAHSFLGRSRALGPLFGGSARGLARSAVALGLSGFLGRVLGQAVPHDRLAEVMDLSMIPGWLFLAALPVLITLGGQIALSPILLVVFLGEVLGEIAGLPTGQWQILFALSIGWSLSMTASPNATATLLISATCQIPPTTLTWRWNLRYGLLCYAVSLVIFACIA